MHIISSVWLFSKTTLFCAPRICKHSHSAQCILVYCDSLRSNACIKFHYRISSNFFSFVLSFLFFLLYLFLFSFFLFFCALSFFYLYIFFFFKSYFEHSEPIFHHLKMLSLYKINYYLTSMFMFRYFHLKNLPELFTIIQNMTNSRANFLCIYYKQNRETFSCLSLWSFSYHMFSLSFKCSFC